MDKLLELCAKRPVVPTGVINGVPRVFSDESSSSESEDDHDYSQYEQEFVKEELGRYAASSSIPNTRRADDFNRLCDVEGVEGYDFRNNSVDIYSKYKFKKSSNKRELPIDSFKEKILHLIDVNNVVIIQGPTGCGKTTQVPQFILDDCREKGAYCNIVVTQPRKIATINVAKRVCEERGWTLGKICGYQIGLQKVTSSDILITYMTTGTLLQKLINDKQLNQFTHILIDEVHERNQELDFLLLIVRKFLFTNSPNTKVILMSATIEAEEFAHYFRCQNLNTTLPAPIIYVDKKSFFTKTIFYMEQLLKALDSTRTTMPDYDIHKPEISEGLWNVFTFLVSIIDKLDTVDPLTGKKLIGSILVFLPGIHEIEEAKRRLEIYFKKITDEKSKVNREDDRVKWAIIPLHSSLPNDEQALVFQPPTPGHRKVILSTNIAESSITVPDSYYVIDFCQTKVMTVDPVTKYMSLKLEWASHVNCEQRAGRVGRIGNGRVYRLVPTAFYFDEMEKRSIPEILNAPLERVVLQAKALNLKDTPAQILALSLSPPNLKNIENTILTLKEIGALLPSCRGISSNSDGDVTFLGKIMAKLPIDVRLTKLILLGQIFGCFEEAIIIAAGCSIQNVFSTPFQQRFNAYTKLLLWADGSCSDSIALLNLFQVWQTYKRDNHFRNYQAEQNWCNINLINFKGLREWNLLVTELKNRLELLNIRETSGPNKIILAPFEKPFILKVITCGAFYPNFFLKAVPIDAEAHERDAVKTVAGRDPLRTVYFTGMDPYQPGPLYAKSIKKMIKNQNSDGKDIFIGFDGSSKIYVEFKSSERRQNVAVSMAGLQQVTNLVAGKIPFEVYEAIRKRQLNFDFSLDLLHVDVAMELARAHGIESNNLFLTLCAASSLNDKNCYSHMYFNPVPSLDVQYITLKITDYIDASHFWANTLESEHYLAIIEEILNKQLLHQATTSENLNDRELKVGKMYAARYYSDNLFYRCKILAHTGNSVQIIFIDYGNLQQVTPAEIFLLPDKPECQLPPLSIECVLNGIQPSLRYNPKGVWSERINNICRDQIVGFLLYGKIYSVVDDVVYLELYKSQPNNCVTKSINQIMIERGYAELCPVSFLSKADHEKRQLVCSAENPLLEAARFSINKTENYRDFEVPKTVTYEKTIRLKGPFSPLEIKLHGCIQSSQNKSVDIDGSSVNTVLLDNEPQAYQTSLLVAGYVGQTANGSRLRLRQTTLLPNIPGIPMVLALMFCPTMRVKLTNDGTRVASILCGLGYNEVTNKAIYPAHDLTITLDTILTEDEVNKINQMRFYMNQGIKLMNLISDKEASENEMIRTQNSLVKELKELIYMPREMTERTDVKFANIWWRNNSDAIILKPNMCNDADDIWPLLWFVKLKQTENYSPTVKKNLDDLNVAARNMMRIPEDFKCELCNELLYSVYDVRYHLMSNTHKNNLTSYNENIEQCNLTDEDDDEN